MNDDQFAFLYDTMLALAFAIGSINLAILGAVLPLDSLLNTVVSMFAMLGALFMMAVAYGTTANGNARALTDLVIDYPRPPLEARSEVMP